VQHVIWEFGYFHKSSLILKKSRTNNERRKSWFRNLFFI